MTEKDLKTYRILFPFVYDKKLTKENIRDIVTGPAYKDMTPRNLPGIGNKDNRPIRDKMLNDVAERFNDYFHSDPLDKDDFNEWHNETCEHICDIFKPTSIELKYGKAQKLVNIAFKHFLLFDDANERYFAYCHTPIDNNVLSWCRDTAKIDCKPNGWSNMDYDEYIDLQNNIRAFLDKDSSLKYVNNDNQKISNLILDFFVWAEYSNTIKEYWDNIKMNYDLYVNMGAAQINEVIKKYVDN